MIKQVFYSNRREAYKQLKSLKQKYPDAKFVDTKSGLKNQRWSVVYSEPKSDKPTTLDQSLVRIKAKAQQAAGTTKIVKAIKPVTVQEIKPVKPLNWSMGPKYISITSGDKTVVAQSDHPNFKEAQQAVFSGDVARAYMLVSDINKLHLRDGKVFFADKEINFSDFVGTATAKELDLVAQLMKLTK